MTRSLNGAVSSHGLSSNGPCSVVGSTAANPAPDCEYCRSFVEVLRNNNLDQINSFLNKMLNIKLLLKYVLTSFRS